MQGLHIHTTRPFNLARGNFEWRLPSDSESNLQQFQVKTTSYLYQCSTGIYSWTSFIHFLYNQYYLYPTQYHSVTCQSTLACATIVYIHASTSTLKACVLRFITGDFFLTHHCIIHKEAVWCSLGNWRYLFTRLCWKDFLLPSASLWNLSTLLRMSHYDHRYFDAHKWTELQKIMKLHFLISLEHFHR